MRQESNHAELTLKDRTIGGRTQTWLLRTPTGSKKLDNKIQTDEIKRRELIGSMLLTVEGETIGGRTQNDLSFSIKQLGIRTTTMNQTGASNLRD